MQNVSFFQPHHEPLDVFVHVRPSFVPFSPHLLVDDSKEKSQSLMKSFFKQNYFVSHCFYQRFVILNTNEKQSYPEISKQWKQQILITFFFSVSSPFSPKYHVVLFPISLKIQQRNLLIRVLFFFSSHSDPYHLHKHHTLVHVYQSSSPDVTLTNLYFIKISFIDIYIYYRNLLHISSEKYRLFTTFMIMEITENLTLHSCWSLDENLFIKLKCLIFIHRFCILCFPLLYEDSMLYSVGKWREISPLIDIAPKSRRTLCKRANERVLNYSFRTSPVLSLVSTRPAYVQVTIYWFIFPHTSIDKSLDRKNYTDLRITMIVLEHCRYLSVVFFRTHLWYFYSCLHVLPTIVQYVRYDHFSLPKKISYLVNFIVHIHLFFPFLITVNFPCDVSDRWADGTLIYSEEGGVRILEMIFRLLFLSILPL